MEDYSWINRHILTPLATFVRFMASMLSNILGIIFIIIIILMWLTFFGIIPQGERSDDRYYQERSDNFR